MSKKLAISDFRTKKVLLKKKSFFLSPISDLKCGNPYIPSG